MTEAAAIKESAAINEEMLERDPRGEITGLLVQMMAIEKLARAGLPKEARELLDLAVAKEETAAIRAEGQKTH